MFTRSFPTGRYDEHFYDRLGLPAKILSLVAPDDSPLARPCCDDAYDPRPERLAIMPAFGQGIRSLRPADSAAFGDGSTRRRLPADLQRWDRIAARARTHPYVLMFVVSVRLDGRHHVPESYTDCRIDGRRFVTTVGRTVRQWLEESH